MLQPRSHSHGRHGYPMSSAIGTLCPAVFTDQTTAEPTTSPTNMHLNPSASQCATTCSLHGSMPPTRPTTPYTLSIIDDHMPDHGEGNPFLHPTLRKSICPADYNYILKLKPRLTATNYTTWRTVICIPSTTNRVTPPLP